MILRINELRREKTNILQPGLLQTVLHDLHLCFSRICKMLVFPQHGSYIYVILIGHMETVHVFSYLSFKCL